MAVRRDVVGSWAFPFVVAFVANIFYMSMSWIPNHKYLQWVEQKPQCQDHLPDVFLDLHDFGEQASILTTLADSLPCLMLLVTATACAVTNNLLIWNRFLLTQAFVILLNCVAEQATVIPSSYGFQRCKAYLGIRSAAEDHFGFSATGSCVAMIWSGHVFHMMIGGYMLGKILEEQIPALRRHTLWGTSSAPLLKSVIVVVLAVGEMSILVVDKGHYTVDMWLAIVISMLTFTNDNIEYWVFCANPFIARVVPERLQPKKHGQLREMLHQYQLKAGGAEHLHLHGSDYEGYNSDDTTASVSASGSSLE